MKNDEISNLTDEQINVMFGGVNCVNADYCNDPAVMWPIIVENGISIIKHEDYHAFTAFVAAGIDDAEHDIWMMADHRADDINPLRAAAIVYLRIKGAL